jgi:hypothetical protein
LLIGTVDSNGNSWALTVTAATLRPLRFEFPKNASRDQVQTRLRDAIPDDQYLDDPHGSPAYRKHLTLYFGEEIRRELSGESRS